MEMSCALQMGYTPEIVLLMGKMMIMQWIQGTLFSGKPTIWDMGTMHGMDMEMEVLTMDRNGQMPGNGSLNPSRNWNFISWERLGLQKYNHEENRELNDFKWELMRLYKKPSKKWELLGI